nr:hypothetical protein [Tanacetum cinerariifolium]
MGRLRGHDRLPRHDVAQHRGQAQGHGAAQQVASRKS